VGFLDSLRGIFKQQPAQASVPTAPSTNSFAEVRERLKLEKEKRLASVYPECGKIVGQIKDEYGALKDTVLALEGKQPSQEQFENIALQMRENFLKRMPPLLAVQFPQKIDYDSVRAFHSAVFNDMAQITKVVSDNRYLFGLYKEGMESFAGRMKKIGELADALRAKILEKSEDAEAFDEAEAVLAEAEEALRRKQDNEARERALSDALKLKEDAAEKQAESWGRDRALLDRGRQELFAVEDAITRKRDALAARLMPLQRVFRKVERNAGEKTLAEAARAYADAPVDALLADDGVRLESVMKAAKAYVEDLKQDAVIDEMLSGKILQDASALKREEAIREEKRKSLAPYYEQEARLKDAKKAKDEASSEFQRTCEKTAYLLNEFEGKRKHAEEKASALLGAKVILKA